MSPRPSEAHVPRPTRSAQVLATELDDELVLYDADSSEAFVLNPTGARIWSLCDGSRTIDDIAGELAELYGLDHDRALTDTHELLDHLGRSGLVTT